MIPAVDAPRPRARARARVTALCGALWLVGACEHRAEEDAGRAPASANANAERPPASAKTKPTPTSAPPGGRALATLDGARASGPLALTHGGVGSPPKVADGPARAAEEALAIMLQKPSSEAEEAEAPAASGAARSRVDGHLALAAAIAGTRALEDDPRFNAGTGANIRLDGKTIQMDAALMSDRGDYAAVAVIERVTSPITAARHVLDSPHVLLAGEGATRFAHKMGLPDVVPTSPEAEAKYRERLTRLGELVGQPGSDAIDWRDYWNFPGELPAEIEAWARGGDTVGTVARDGEGRFAAALSTGGTSVTLYGRVGDVPIYGAGLFAGPAGAVACTGHGEEIIRQGLARRVYENMASGTSAREAVASGVRGFREDSEVGLIAVDAHGWGVAASREMAFGVAPRAETTGSTHAVHTRERPARE